MQEGSSAVNLNLSHACARHMASHEATRMCYDARARVCSCAEHGFIEQSLVSLDNLKSQHVLNGQTAMRAYAGIQDPHAQIFSKLYIG